MWWFITKKRFRDALKGIRKHILSVSDSTKSNTKELSNLKDKVSKLEGSLDMLLKFQTSVKPVSDKKETYVIKKFRRAKRQNIIAKISELMKSLSVIEIKEIIVDQDALCSKASYYRYISSLKDKSEIDTETKLR